MENGSCFDTLKLICDEVIKFNYSPYTWFKYDNSRLISSIISKFNFNIDNIKYALNRLSKTVGVISMQVIYYNILKNNFNLYKQIANESIITSLYNNAFSELSYYDDNSNLEFQFSAMYAPFDFDKSYYHLLSGFDNSICRPSFRKDSTVYEVIQCLDVLAENRFYTEKELEEFSEKFLEMIKISDNTLDSTHDMPSLKKFLERHIPNSQLLKSDNFYDISTSHDIIQDESFSKSSDINIHSDKELIEYYSCNSEEIDYSSISTWNQFINYELNNGGVKLLYEEMRKQKFPNSLHNYMGKYFHIISAALLNNQLTKNEFMKFVLSQGGRTGLIILIKGFALNGNISSGKMYFEQLMKLTEFIIAPSGKIILPKKLNVIADIINSVENSSVHDWYINESDERIFRINPCIKIISCGYENSEPFNEKWAINHIDKNARMYEHYLYYHENLLKTYILVSVDGGRAMLPLPKLGTDKISRADYRISVLITGTEQAEYIHRSKLIVE